MNYSPCAVQPRLYNYSSKTRLSSRKVSIYPLNALQSLPWNCKPLRLPKGQWDHRPPASLPSWVRTRNLQWRCRGYRELQRSLISILPLWVGQKRVLPADGLLLTAQGSRNTWVLSKQIHMEAKLASCQPSDLECDIYAAWPLTSSPTEWR